MKKYVKQGLVVMLVLTMVGGLLPGMGVQKVKAASKKYMDVSNLKAGIGWVIERSNYLETNYSISKLSFTSSKKSVATVSSKGKITTKAKGKTTITIKNKSTKKKLKSFTVTVKYAERHKDFTFRKFGVGADWSNLSLVSEIKKTDYWNLMYDAIAYRNLKARYTTKSDNEEIFTIDSNGKNFKALKAGTANLVFTETYKGKKKTISCPVECVDIAIPEELQHLELDLYSFSDTLEVYDENGEAQEKEFCNSGKSEVDGIFPMEYGIGQYIFQIVDSEEELTETVTESSSGSYDGDYYECYTDRLYCLLRNEGSWHFSAIPTDNEEGKIPVAGTSYVRFFAKMEDGTYKNVGTISITVKDNSAEYNEYQEALKAYNERHPEDEGE